MVRYECDCSQAPNKAAFNDIPFEHSVVAFGINAQKKNNGFSAYDE